MSIIGTLIGIIILLIVIGVVWWACNELLPLIRRARPTLLCSLPGPLFSLARDHKASREDFQSVRRCVAGGDRIAAELEHLIHDLFAAASSALILTAGTSPAENRFGSKNRASPVVSRLT